MSRARELAKFGGSGQQIIAGVSSHVGVSTFASNVFMYQDLSVTGNINVTGDLTYDEVSARNQFTSGITTTADLIVTRNANFSGIITAAKGVVGNINATGVSTAAFLQASTVNASGIVTASSFTGSLTGNVTGSVNATGVSTAAFLQATTVNVSAAATVPTLSATTFTATTANITNTNSTNTVLSGLTTVSNTVAPNANNTVSLGTSGNRWANVYSNDLDLSNEGSVNDIDGTWGSFLVQEGEEHLYIINRRSGKKFRFVLEEI